MSSCTINETTIREPSRIITVFTYIMYYVQDYSILYNKVVLPVTCEGLHFTHNCKQLHDPIIWAHKTRLTPSLFIEVPVPSKCSMCRFCLYLLSSRYLKD